MKLLVTVSALDLRLTLGATSAWWQLLKALRTAGHEVLVTPYAGAAVESPWWRSFENPCLRESQALLRLKSLVNRLGLSRSGSRSGPLAAALVRNRITPRWRRHLAAILERERDVDAMLVFNVPMNHFSGIPEALRERFGIPVLYYDGDMPMSLPRYRGYASGFQGYDKANLSEYDTIVSNSRGVEPELLRLGARRAATLFFAADAELFSPIDSEKDIDVLFYGFGSELREQALTRLIGKPSRLLSRRRFVVAGKRLHCDLGHAEVLGPVTTSQIRSLTSRARVNLHVVRKPHAEHQASSTMRLFELAACGAAIVMNKAEGTSEWFEPGKELLVVDEQDDAPARLEDLLSTPSLTDALGERARQRALREHTYGHRARALEELIRDLGVSRG